MKTLSDRLFDLQNAIGGIDAMRTPPNDYNAKHKLEALNIVEVMQKELADSELKQSEPKYFERHAKPPLGVMPQRIWKERRAAELSRAIDEYLQGGFIGGDYPKSILLWTDELSGIMREIEQEESAKLAQVVRTRFGQ